MICLFSIKGLTLFQIILLYAIFIILGHGFSLNMIDPNCCNIGDIILYNNNNNRRCLGIINNVYSSPPATNLIGENEYDISRLGIRGEQSEENQNEIILFVDDVDNDSVLSTLDSNEILDVLDSDLYILEQRAIQDRISNPHGEHAEDVIIVQKKVLDSITNLELPELEGH